ncbi:hypothetical protein L596_023305 [Steinernema carpocapsae]|uniref:Uncharacterized protein n=1 Tax=Steinernema carpocapsae TaxID=34508 RepID=A0A4U5ME15_STECR|nr:hypothetical protein L596_023305 [Steinernema carpocapsae]
MEGLNNKDLNDLSELRGSIFSDSIQDLIQSLSEKNPSLADRVKSLHKMFSFKMGQISPGAKEFVVNLLTTVINAGLQNRSNECSESCLQAIRMSLPKLAALSEHEQSEIRVVFANINDFFRSGVYKNYVGLT